MITQPNVSAFIDFNWTLIKFNSIPTKVTLITNITNVFSFLFPPRCCQQQLQNNNGAAVTAIMPFLQSQTQSHGSNQSIESIVHDTQVFTRIGLFQVRMSFHSFHWLLSFILYWFDWLFCFNNHFDYTIKYSCSVWTWHSNLTRTQGNMRKFSECVTYPLEFPRSFV